MHQDRSINLDAIDPYVDILVRQNIKHVYVNGTNGEGPSLTIEERKQTLEKWISAGKNKLTKVIAQVGAGNLNETKELAAHAQQVGADAIGVLPPYFFKPSNVERLVMYLIEVSRSAPDLPMLYYHFPDQTGLKLSIVDIVEACVARVPTFCGVKFTDYDLLAYGRCLLNEKYGKQLTMAYGRDEQLAGALMLGADVAVGGTYNYAGKIYDRMYAAIARGDVSTAMTCQQQSQRFIDVFIKNGFDVGINKSVMGMVTGLECGPPRLPLLPATPQHLETLKAQLQQIGFFDNIK